VNKRCINTTYDAALVSPVQQSSTPVIAETNIVNTGSNAQQNDMTHTTSPVNDNSSRLAELEESIKSIQLKCVEMETSHKQLCEDFPKVLSGLMQHSKEIQAMQHDVKERFILFDPRNL
jgi:TolA-binding protein